MSPGSLIELPRVLTAPAGETAARYVMGVDGGATKTLAAVFDLRTGELRVGHGGSSNPDAVGERSAREALARACGQALETLGISGAQLDGAVLAMSGTDTDAIRTLVQSYSQQSLGAARSAERMGAAGSAERKPEWVVVNDVVGAWAAATGAAPGVGAIAGTGSNVLAVGPDGRAWRAGGWGQVFGDEGSGYWLAVRSIAAALHERDGTGPPTALSQAAVRFFEVQRIEQLSSMVYSKPLSKGELAAFAVESARAAAQGDEVARALYGEAARRLGTQIQATIRETGLQGQFPVGLIGGAFKAGPLYVDALARVVHEQASDAQVAVATMAPVGGCLLLAARAAGGESALDQYGLERLLARELAV